MSRHDAPPIIMTVEGGRLVPASAFDQEAIDRYSNGSELTVTLWKGRNPKLLRKYWWVLNCIVKNAPTPWTDATEASDAMKLALGKVRVGKDRHGNWFTSPDSVSLPAMEEPEFNEYFEMSMAILAEVSGVDPVAFTEEHTETQKQKQESVATSSQATDALPECEDSPSVDISASAAGDSGSSPTSPAEIPADENKRLIDFARDMFSNLSAGNAKMIETNWMPEIKGFSEPAKSAAREVSKSIRAILNDGHDAEYALAYFAEALGCETGDLKDA